MEELNLTEHDIRAAYQSAVRDNQIRFAMVGGVLALVLLPAGVSLDYFVYPAHLAQFLFIRLACDGFIALACLFYFRPAGRAYFRSLTFTWIFSIQVALCLMIYLTDGARSPYYAGLNLVILATGVVLPLSFTEILGFSAATLAVYVATCVVHGSAKADMATFFNNIYFILLTTIISATAGFFHERQRYSEFRFSYELGFRNKELAELDRLKSQFFANISHELRTPLTLILAPLEDLLSGSERLPDRIAGALGIARSNALRLLKLVNDLLDVIRLEEGRTELEREPLNIIALLRGVVESMSHLAEAREVSLSHRLPPVTYVVVGDESALEKVFFNLLSNALKFTPAKGRIVVSTSVGDQEIVVRVADTGIGIHSKDLPFVFDRFKQADASSTRPYAGTGLGLALVKELTEAHGGHVEVSSKPGAGTTMSVYLP
ncbi:MAG TPA: HAMP domain-containing sensor histidine kinase, partial [Gammaproteobacteria bacterium]|nr:HAMP domain-containing sensor histidine kinase [Gammaproteobacteria bacterium]